MRSNRYAQYGGRVLPDGTLEMRDHNDNSRTRYQYRLIGGIPHHRRLSCQGAAFEEWTPYTNTEIGAMIANRSIVWEYFMASQAARALGSMTSEKKKRSSAENAKKGGRPCSHANTDGSARPWELRRFKAGHACHSCGRVLGTDGYWYVDADQAPGYPFGESTD